MAAKKDWTTVASEESVKESEQSTELDPDLDPNFGGGLDEAEQDLAESENLMKQEITGIQKLQQAIRDAEDKATENWEKMVRAVSDLDNTRRRAERDVQNAHKYALEKFITELLPVIDSLEQAAQLFEENDESGSHGEGVLLTLKMFMDVLDKFSVEQLNPLGDTFDPHKHEAMSMQETSDAKPNTILAVFQKGYVLQDRVIRPARVIVAKAEPNRTSEEVSGDSSD